MAARKDLIHSAMLVVLAGIWAAACQPSGPPGESAEAIQPPPVPSDPLLLASAKVALPPPGIDLVDLPDQDSSGAQYLQQYCTACHALTTPWAHSATDWPLVLRRMWLRIERIDPSFNVPVPNAGERMAMLQYLEKHALKVTPGALPEGRNREFFLTTCSQCHEVPDPRQHSAQDWTAVVRRMTDHMVPMLGTTLTPEDLGRVVQYLEVASAGTP